MGWKPNNLPRKGTDAYDRYVEDMVRRAFSAHVRGARLVSVQADAKSSNPLHTGHGIINVVWEPRDGAPACHVLGPWLEPFARSMRMLGDPLFHDHGGPDSYIVACSFAPPPEPSE